MHENSKIVRVKRKMPLIQASQNDPEVMDWFSQSKGVVGPYLSKNGNGTSESGLTLDEERLLLPSILHLEYSHVEFLRKRDIYYREFSSEVPSNEKGLELEVGLTKDNNKPVSEDNLPINPSDYIRYKHIINNTAVVAKDERDAKRYHFKKFFVETPGEKQKELLKSKKLERQAKSLVDKLLTENDQKKMLRILSLLGVSAQEIVFNRTPEQISSQIEADLDLIASKSSKEFLDVVNDPDFDEKYAIYEYKRYGVMKTINGKIYDIRNNPIGTEDTVIAILKDENDPNNSELVQNWNSLLEVEKEKLNG